MDINLTLIKTKQTNLLTRALAATKLLGKIHLIEASTNSVLNPRMATHPSKKESGTHKKSLFLGMSEVVHQHFTSN
jgi:hypothetical protein